VAFYADKPRHVDLRLFVNVGHFCLTFYSSVVTLRTASLTQTLRSVYTLRLCVLCGSENKQRLFHCTALTDWFV